MPSLLDRPLSWLNPLRLQIPEAWCQPGLHQALNPLLAQRLAPLAAEPPPRWWCEHWLALRPAAELLGAYHLWPDLARGGLSQRLTPPQRRFASLRLGPRIHQGLAAAEPLALRVEARGLRVLLDALPASPALHERLVLMFSPRAEQLALACPAGQAHFVLIVQAVQHARHSKTIR